MSKLIIKAVGETRPIQKIKVAGMVAEVALADVPVEITFENQVLVDNSAHSTPVHTPTMPTAPAPIVEDFENIQSTQPLRITDTARIHRFNPTDVALRIETKDWNGSANEARLIENFNEPYTNALQQGEEFIKASIEGDEIVFKNYQRTPQEFCLEVTKSDGGMPLSLIEQENTSVRIENDHKRGEYRVYFTLGAFVQAE